MRPSLVFVFGSNLAGRHGAGAARDAVLHWGAQHGKGFGMQGNSYAIPTKDAHLKPMTTEEIRPYVYDFLRLAMATPHVMYYVTPIGTGLAKMKNETIAPLFKGAPNNCMFISEWLPYVDG